MATKTKADASFDRKLKHLLTKDRLPPETLPAGAFPGLRPLDTEAVAELFRQYGVYLELTDYEPPKPKLKELMESATVFVEHQRMTDDGAAEPA